MAIRVIPKPSDPPKTFPTYIAAVSGTWGSTTENDLTIDVGSGVNRKAVVFLVNQDNQARTEPFPYTCSYEPTGENIRLDRVLDGGDLSQFDSWYYTSLFYYDIPDNDSGTKTFRFNTSYTLRGGGQIVIYKDSLSGAPYTSSVETAATQSAGGPHPFSYVSASLTLDGPSTVVSFALFEKDVVGATLSPLGIETVRGNFNYGGTLGGDVIAGDFKSNKPTITTEYTSSQSGSLVTCTALALQSFGYAPDFKIQRGVVNTTAVSSSVLLAGVDYEPINSSSAFVRITSNRSIGSGQYDNFAGGDEQFKISDITNIETSLQFEKVGTTTAGDTIDWEIIEYTGRAGGDNEFIVRHVEELTFSNGSVTQQSSSVVPNIQNDNDVVVFLGGANRLNDAGAGRTEPVTLAVTSWDSSSQRAFVDKYQEQFSAGRGSELQIMVVEFTGKNWKVQRIPEHTFSSRDEESISIPVNISSTSSAFIHSQYRFDRINGTGPDQNKNLTAKVYLKDVNTIEAKVTGSAAGTQGSGSVAVWLIENTQKHGQKMNVTHYSGFRDRELSTNPDIFSSSLQSTVNIDTTSIMGESAARDISNAALNDYNNLQFSIGISSSGQEVVITRGTDINGIDYTFSTVEWPTEYRNKGISIQSDTQWFFDDFNRPNQSITASSDWDENTLYDADNGVNWFIEDGALGGQDFTALAGFAFLNTASYQWTNDQLAEVVYADIGTFDYGGPAVRLNFGPGHESGSGYVLRHDGLFDDSRRIYRIDNGTLDTTYRNVTYTIVAGDKVRLEAVGNTINCYVNGILEDSLTDSTYESGSVGVFYKKENNLITRLDNFYAQNIVSGQTGKPFKIS